MAHGVLKAQGNLPAALKSYHDELAIADQLTKADPSNASWQRDLEASYQRIGNADTARIAQKRTHMFLPRPHCVALSMF
jgi:Flp pilus assembly protein TadD